MVQVAVNKYRAMAMGVIHNVGDSVDDMGRLRALAVRVGVFMGRERTKSKGGDIAGGVAAGVAAAETAIGQGREKALTFIFVVTEELCGAALSPLVVSAWLTGRGIMPPLGHKTSANKDDRKKNSKKAMSGRPAVVCIKSTRQKLRATR